MVEFLSVKIYRDNLLVMKGNRYCIQFEPDDGEFVNVRTGDKVEIEIQLKSDQLSREALVPVIQRILLTSRVSEKVKGAARLTVFDATP